MGLTFKENIPDIRNTKVIDLIKGFKNLNMNVDVYDPYVDKSEAMKEYSLPLISKPIKNKYDVIVIAVKHNQFTSISFKSLLKLCKKKNVIYDLKNIFPNEKKIIRI